MLTPRQSMQRIQDRMTLAEMSLTALVERTGVERSVYKAATSAEEHLPVGVLIKVAEALDVSVAWLIGESNHPSRETSYQIYLTPRPVRYEEIRVERRESGEVALQVLMDDRIADFNLYPETVGRLIAEFTAALRGPLTPPLSAAPVDMEEKTRNDAFAFSPEPERSEAGLNVDYSYTVQQAG